MVMLGSECNVCCGKCGCKKGKLPYTMTVTLSGLENKTHGNYCDLVITSDVGGGAAGVATTPGGCDGDTDPVCGTIGKDSSGKCDSTTTYSPSNRGPLTGVLLTENGSGYVSLRSPPTVSAGGGSGTSAEFGVTLKQDKCDWSVKSVSVTGGKDYVEGDSLSFTIADGDTQKTPAQATLHTQRAEPTLTASAPGGVGASLTVSYTQNEGTPSTWSISGITVASGGTGYHGGDSVTFTLGKSDTEVSAASATITTSRVEPTLSASVSGTGSGASLTVSLTPNSEGTSWSVSAIGITDGGTGYSEWDYVTVNVVDGQTEGWPYFYAYVSSVDENGAITAVTIYYNYGSYFKEGGVIQSVALSDGGSYYKDTGIPDTVDVTNGGKYYRDDPNGEPCAAVTVTPCGGLYDGYYGYDGYIAKISATVDADKTSSTYGQITDLTIDEGGEGYLAWNWINTCREKLNGIPFVLKADTPEPLVSLSFESCFGSGAKASVTPLGSRTQPDICLTGYGIGGTITPTLKSDVEDGNEWLKYWSFDSVSASGGYGYINGQSAAIDYHGATVPEAAQVTLQATGITVEVPPNAKNDGVLTGATVVKAGKFYVQHAYDGTAGPIKLVKLESGGSGYAIFGREQPTLTIQPSEGSLGAGATFTPTFSKHQDSCGVDYWIVESVSVSGGTCFGVKGRTAPTLTASAEGGSGATFSVQTETAKDGCGGTYWKVSKITPSLGVGYTDGSPVTITAPENVTVKTAAVASLVTDGPGAPTSVVISEPGHYFVKGPDESLSVAPATSDDKEQQKAVFTVKANDSGVPTSVTVASKGSYYRENKSLTPYVANVTVKINQTLPSNGSGAVITPTIETNTSSNKFGQITKLTVENGGSGYQLLGGPLDCRYSGPCGLALQFRGAGREAEVTLQDAVFRTADKLEDCTKLPSSASVFHSIGEGNVAIAPGGAWDDKVVCPCDNGTCTPVPSQECGQPESCPPCVGECDSCNQCGYGCGCSGGKCEPCVDSDAPHPDGCLYDCCSCDGQCGPKTYADCLQCGGQPGRIIGIETVPCLKLAGGNYVPSCSANQDCCPMSSCDGACEWPEQITVDISGMPEGYGYRFQNGGNGMPLPPDVGSDLTFRVVGNAFGLSYTHTGNLPQNGSYVLDRVSADCNQVEYSGVAPGWACSSFGPACGETQDLITVRLTPSACAVTGVGFSSTFGSGAHGVVTGYNHTTGAITGVKLCNGGKGYARVSGGSVQTADVTVIVISQHGGEGAVIEATIDSSPESATFGQITALAVTNGGTGYGIGGWTISGSYSSGFGQIDFLAGVDLSPGFAVCQIGQDLSGFEEPAGELLSKEKCGTDLLSKSYSGRFSVETFPGAVDAAAGVTYSLGHDAIHNVCDVLEVVGITWAIS